MRDMNNSRRWRLSTSLAVMAVTLPALAAQAGVSYTDLYTLTLPTGYDVIQLSGPHNIDKGYAIGSGWGSVTSGRNHALMWNPQGQFIDLNPSNTLASYGYATDGVHQGGSIFKSFANPYDNAALWYGTAASASNLHAANMTTSQIFDISGNQQVGVVTVTGNTYVHAFLWNSSAGTAVNLQPTGITSSLAFGTSGNQQVGQGAGTLTGNKGHALLWSGTAASMLDLHPGAAYTESSALGTNGQYQVGYAYETATGDQHAIAWAGSATAFVDLNPNGFSSSSAIDVSDLYQVGSGKGNPTNNKDHALLWRGTAESVIDLHSYLPANLVSSSARSIDGNIIYGMAKDTNNLYHAIAWTLSLLSGDTNDDGVVDISDYNNVINNFGSSGQGDTNNDGIVDVTDYNNVINNFGVSATVSFVPEPASLSVLGIAGLGLLARRRNA